MEYCKKIELIPSEDIIKKFNEVKDNECSEKVDKIDKEYVSNLLNEILNKSKTRKKRKNKNKNKVKKSKILNKIQDKSLKPLKWEYV